MTTCIGTYSIINKTGSLFADTRVVCKDTQSLGTINKIIEVGPQFAFAVAGSAALITAMRTLVNDPEMGLLGYEPPACESDVMEFVLLLLDNLPSVGITVPATVPAQDMHCQLLILTSYGLWTVTNDRAVMTAEDSGNGYANFMVIGSGRKYATGAMHVTANPDVALDVASQYDYATGPRYNAWHVAKEPNP